MTKRVLFQRRSGASASFVHVVLRKFAGVGQSPSAGGGMSCSATRGLLATDHVILNHGQVTWTTPELAPPSPNYHTTPTGGRFSSRQI
ncbi:hypothetical protein TNCV_4071371 [Trichonephila clavipes]|uniref:Uncharacterized protein n=1 Tax=Trichonephila clavipes TaxID=2585209 RepID=A0A8X7BGN0_TRICX|nr:hypothetical protein TNCV_4071371 [Trichonephila clavipes]